jgi:PBP1b-binding outer membrane lipoprotein LpoB
MKDYLSTVLPGVVMLLIVAGAALVLDGCTSNSAPSQSDLKPENLTYFKDSRTDVCYSAMSSLDAHSGWKTTTITYVPCTEKVEAAIKADAGK